MIETKKVSFINMCSNKGKSLSETNLTFSLASFINFSVIIYKVKERVFNKPRLALSLLLFLIIGTYSDK